VFYPKLEKKLVQIRLVVYENAKNAPLIPKNDVTEPKARLLSQFQASGNHGFWKP